MTKKKTKQPPTDQIEMSEVMKKVLADLKKLEVTFSVDEAELKAKRIDTHIVFHLHDTTTH